MFTGVSLAFACLFTVVIAAPALAPQYLQPGGIPLLIRSSQLIPAAPGFTIYQKPTALPLLYSYQSNPLPTSNYLIVRQIDGGALGGYFEMFNDQLTQIQNQSNAVLGDLQNNAQTAIVQGFDWVADGVDQGFADVTQGWGEIVSNWGGGGNRAEILNQPIGDSAPIDATKMESIKLKSQANLLYRPMPVRYYENKFVPFGLVRYNLVPLNTQQLLQQQKKQPEQIQSRNIEMDIKAEDSMQRRIELLQDTEVKLEEETKPQIIPPSLPELQLPQILLPQPLPSANLLRQNLAPELPEKQKLEEPLPAQSQPEKPIIKKSDLLVSATK